MTKIKSAFLSCLLSLGVSISDAAQKKESDLDVVYAESKVPLYTLPDPLVSAEGRTIATPDEWTTLRRPQILALFSSLVYGQMPIPESPIQTEYLVQNVDKEFMGGKATRKEVLIRFSNNQGRAEMLALVFVPNATAKPVPAFMMISFDDNRSDKLKANPDAPGKLRNGWPLGQLLDRGFAFVSVYHQDLVGHNEVGFERGIQPLFFKAGQSFPAANEWGVLATCGWGAMRALDYLETDREVDAQKVVLMGHSKLGKATLWAAAQDQRFAIAISANSGCAGAALWRRRSGETLAKMTTRFPYWLCGSAQKFVGREEDLSVDQHMLLALMAPRPVYVASATEDHWADPRGEYLSAYHASPVYRLLGKRGLNSEKTPGTGYRRRGKRRGLSPTDRRAFNRPVRLGQVQRLQSAAALPASHPFMGDDREILQARLPEDGPDQPVVLLAAPQAWAEDGRVFLRHLLLPPLPPRGREDLGRVVKCGLRRHPVPVGR